MKVTKAFYAKLEKISKGVIPKDSILFMLAKNKRGVICHLSTQLKHGDNGCSFTPSVRSDVLAEQYVTFAKKGWSSCGFLRLGRDIDREWTYDDGHDIYRVGIIISIKKNKIYAHVEGQLITLEVV